MASVSDSRDRPVGRLRVAVFALSSAALALMIVVMVLPNVAVPLVIDLGGVHVVHEVIFTLFAVMVLAGLAAQIRRPRQRVAAMTLVFGFLAALAVGSAITAFFFPPALIMLALAVIAAATHPASRRLLTSASARCPATLSLAVVAAVPAVFLAVDQWAIQRGAPAVDEHAKLGHWVAAGAMALLLPALAAVAGWRPAGWRWPAAAAAGGALVIGAVSLGWPAHASSLGVGGGLAAIAWGLVVGGVSLARHRRPATETDDPARGTVTEVTA